jgi:plasmid stabilization system protein ParE
VAYSVRWSERALEDVEALAEYIARDSDIYAQAVVRAIFGVGQRLEQFPFSGRVVSEARGPTIREVLVHSYRVIYRTWSGGVTVITVAHGRQQLIANHLDEDTE